MFNKLKQFKDLRDRAKQIQDVLAQETVEGSAAWGKIKITLNGNQQAVGLSIDDSLLTQKADLEKGLIEAFNDAIQKIQRVMATKLRDVGGVDLAKEFSESFKK